MTSKTDRKRIAIGVGALGAAGLAAYLLLRGSRPDDYAPKPYNCPQCTMSFYTYQELIDHMKVYHPEEPPPDWETGRLIGYVKDAETGTGVPNAAIYMNGEYQKHNRADGGFSISDVLYGTYIITIIADNYEESDFTITLDRQILDIEFVMNPLPDASTPWTYGVKVKKVSVNPTIVYLGETVEIKCELDFIDPMFFNPDTIPDTIYGTVLINGQVLTKHWPTHPVVSFTYTPTQVGEFTIRAQDKSASLEVKAIPPVKSYYSPVGGIRMPEPVRWHTNDGETYERHALYGCVYEDWLGHPNAFLTKKTDGYATWDPPGVVVTDWMVIRYPSHGPYQTFIMVIPLKWTGCPYYWTNKADLDNLLVPVRFIPGRTFRYFLNGSMIDWESAHDILEPYCASRNLAFPGTSVTRRYVAGGYYLRCPYCNYEVKDTLGARGMVNHIEQVHPRYLNEPSYGWGLVHKWGIPPGF